MTEGYTDRHVDDALDKILRAAGSGRLSNYMPYTQDRLREAMREVLTEAALARAEGSLAIARRDTVFAALSASGTKSEIDEAGLERAVRECARITAPEITDSEYEAIRERRDPRYINTRGEMRRALTAYLGEANAVSIKPGPSDPIPSPSAPPLSAPARRR